MVEASVLAAFAAFCLCAHVTSALIAGFRLRAVRAPAGPLVGAPPVSVVQPLCGADRFSEETLRAILTLDYPDYEVVFCAADARDPAVALARRAMADHPERAARLLIGEATINANPKLNNLAKGWAAAKNDWIVVVDANVLPPRDYIQRLLAGWREDTGVVSGPPIGARAENFGAELECAFLNLYQARWQLTADSVGAGFAQGKTLFYRRQIVEAGGGIEALGAELAEDAATTKLVRRLGLKARVARGVFEQPLGARALRAVWARQVRWARLRRASFPVYFSLEIITALPVPALCAAIAAAELGHSPIVATLSCAGLWWGAEAGLAEAAGWRFGLDTLAAAALRDAMMPWLWLQAWFGDSFEWRGRAMSVAERRDDDEGKTAAV